MPSICRPEARRGVDVVAMALDERDAESLAEPTDAATNMPLEVLRRDGLIGMREDWSP